MYHYGDILCRACCILTIQCIDACLFSSLLNEYVPSTEMDILLHFPEFCHIILEGQQYFPVNNSSCSAKGWHVYLLGQQIIQGVSGLV